MEVMANVGVGVYGSEAPGPHNCGQLAATCPTNPAALPVGQSPPGTIGMSWNNNPWGRGYGSVLRYWSMNVNQARALLIWPQTVHTCKLEVLAKCHMTGERRLRFQEQQL